MLKSDGPPILSGLVMQSKKSGQGEKGGDAGPEEGTSEHKVEQEITRLRDRK